MTIRSLYVCYAGLREPLVQSQVLPYLRELVAGGVDVALLTFEPQRRRRWTRDEERAWRERLRGEGIEWHASAYHKRPSLPATLWDIVAGIVRILGIARRGKLDILHARSHVPAAMAAAAKPFAGAKLLFDVRGLLADEYVDAGNWPRAGFLFRLTKSVETMLYRAADGFVVLTERVHQELASSTHAKPLAVIPTCVDRARFAGAAGERDRMRERLGAQDRIVLVYIGSLGGYYLTHEMAELLAAAKEVDPRVLPLLLTQSAPELITTPLAALGFTADDYRIGFAEADELPAYLAASDIAVSFVKPSYSKIASSPTKIAEYLASGLPVISTRGIGDLDEQLEGERVGVVVRELDAASYRRAFERARELLGDPELRARCIDAAARLYDVRTVGGARYLRLYRQLAGMERTT